MLTIKPSERSTRSARSLSIRESSSLHTKTSKSWNLFILKRYLETSFLTCGRIVLRQAAFRKWSPCARQIEPNWNEHSDKQLVTNSYQSGTRYSHCEMQCADTIPSWAVLRLRSSKTPPCRTHSSRPVQRGFFVCKNYVRKRTLFVERMSAFLSSSLSTISTRLFCAAATRQSFRIFSLTASFWQTGRRTCARLKRVKDRSGGHERSVAKIQIAFLGSTCLRVAIWTRTILWR